MISQNARFPYSMLLVITFSMACLSPLVMVFLLYAKGLPDFAKNEPWQVVGWVYSLGLGSSILSGLMFSGLSLAGRRWWGKLTRPFDLGRAVSVGAIGGAMTELLGTWLFRWATGRPISGFWLSGALMAGAIAGAFVSSLLFYRLSKESILERKSK